MATSATPAERRHDRPARIEPSFAHLVQSEWIKTRTLRSTVWCLVILTIVMIGVSVLIAVNRNADQPGPAPIGQMVMNSHIGLSVGQLAIVVLAATSIGSEYTTGMIRTSLAAVPWRKRWLAAKALVVAAITLVTGVLLSVVSFAVLYTMAPTVSGRVMDPDVVTGVLGGGLYLAALALLAFAVATVMRTAVGSVITMSAMSFVLPIILTGTPLDDLTRFLPLGLTPGNAGWAIMQPSSMLGGLAPWAGFAVLCAWVATGMAAAVYLLDRRDA